VRYDVVGLPVPQVRWAFVGLHAVRARQAWTVAVSSSPGWQLLLGGAAFRKGDAARSAASFNDGSYAGLGQAVMDAERAHDGQRPHRSR
jgi:hypothetical protein